ncbi:MAG: agmatinase family protein [Flavobacteriaceae bacterium]
MQKIVLQGIAYDDKSSFMKGTAQAPPLIRECYHSASANYYAENGMEIIPGIFNDSGDLNPGEYFDVETFTRNNLNKQFNIITLGGDHSITFPVFRAFHELKGPVDILHIDAHADLYDEFEGDRYSHACPFARIMEEGLCSRLVQVGIRTMTRHQHEQAAKFSVEVIPAAGFSQASLPEFKTPLYLSLDMDALDPAYAPGISHYEPGGLTSRQVLDIIQQINVPLVGADIVEYNPTRDINRMTGMLCAKFLKEISAKMLESI